MKLNFVFLGFVCLLLTSCGVYTAVKEKSLITLGMGPNKLNSIGINDSKAILIVAFIQGLGKVDLSQLENPWIEVVGDKIVTKVEPNLGSFTGYERSNQISGVTPC